MHDHFAHAALSALNHLLAGANWARERLRPFAGRTLKLLLPPLELDLIVDPEGYFSVNPASATDVCIELPAATRLLALRQEGTEGLLRQARIEGNAEFASEVGFVLRNLRWDYEEDLSRWVGDIAAHRLATQGRKFLRWQNKAGHNLAENLSEYLVEERALLVSTNDLQSLSRDFQAFESQLDALEQRMQRLLQTTPKQRAPRQPAKP
jgi:ubiquinone biosynthesis protein UbiJ